MSDANKITINVPFSKVWYTSVDYPLGAFASCILGNENIIYHTAEDKKDKWFCGFYLPSFQRKEVWPLENKIRLIESLFCEINIGTILFVSNFDCPEVDGWLIDGKQRLSAIRDFVLGKFAVFNDRLSYSNMEQVTLKFNGSDELNKPKPAHLIWKRNWVHCARIEHVTDINILKELYNRLNFGGVPHKKSEIAK